MLGERAAARRIADPPRLGRAEPREMIGNGGAVLGDEDLASGREEPVDPFPRIGDQAGAGAGGLENTRRRAVAV